MKKFEIGKEYFDRSACNHDCIFTIKIIKRTEKTVTFERRSKAAAMPGNDLVLAVAQRNDDKVLKNFPCNFDCRFQFPDFPHGIEIVFRRHKVKDAQFLIAAFRGAWLCTPAARRRL